MRDIELSSDEQQIALELILGAAQFTGLQRLGFQAAEFRHDQVDDLQGAFRGGSGVDAQRAGVAIGARSE